jgi:serine phosphatase RsbU (regulator of sigma subunit)
MPGSKKSYKGSGYSLPGQVKVANQEIMASLRYAELIQKALMPSEQLLKRLLGEHFIFLKPKEVISGDFYWVTQKDLQTYIVAADCTGHGVPGALMSILGISFLNEIVKSGCTDRAGRILNRIREKVMESLHQTGDFDESKDGMDLALCIINRDRSSMQFAGANNPVYIIRDGILMETKADKMPVGIDAMFEQPFTTHDIEIVKNDRIYLFSDGYPDQFGGPAGKKFKYRPFKQLLLDIHQKDMQEQHDILKESMISWMGDNEQVDDILIMGFTIT